MTPDDFADSRAHTDTRSIVRGLLLSHGILSAAEIADELGLTPAGVRRHLDQMELAGEIEAVRRRPSGGRGRPARAFQLTAAGRTPFEHGYDRLAEEAIDALREVGGPEAVRGFARQRIMALLDHIRPVSDPGDVPRAAEEIAAALSAAGYEASMERAGTGVQICQHHCPVWNVASRFPELCAAEQEVVSEIVGTHVQRLSTIAGGSCACTTNIPGVPLAISTDLVASMPAPSGRHPDSALRSTDERISR